jgi:hypothetical protein
MRLFLSRFLAAIVFGVIGGFGARAEVDVGSDTGKHFVGDQLQAFQSGADGAIVASHDAWINLYYTEGKPFKLSGEVWLGGESATLDHPRDLPDGFALFIREWDSLHRYALTSRAMTVKRRLHDNVRERKIVHVHSFPNAELGRWIPFSLEATASRITYKFGDETGVIEGPLSMDGANKIEMAAGTKIKNVELEVLNSPMATATPASGSSPVPAPTASAQNSLDVDKNGTVHVAIQTTPGRTYRLEFKHDLSDVTWTPVGDPIAGTGEKIVMQEPAKDHGFYHVVVVP